MITTQNIYKAIRVKLSSGISSVTVQIKDIKNPNPPCFYIQYVSSNENESANDLINTVTSFAIYYFSDKKTLLDLLEKEESLRKLFKKPLKVEFANGQNTESRFLNIDNINTSLNETDYILTMTLDFNFYQNADVNNPYDDYNNTELMQILEGV